MTALFCLPCRQTFPTESSLTNDNPVVAQSEGKTNAKPSAFPATEGCEGRLSKLVEHNEVNRLWLSIGVRLQKVLTPKVPKTIDSYNGWLH